MRSNPNFLRWVRAARLSAGHADTIAMFPDGTHTASDAAAAIGSAILGFSVKTADARWVRDVTGFAIGGVAPVGHLSPARLQIDEDLMALDPIWAAAGSPRHNFRTSAREIAQVTGGNIADVKKS